MTNRNVAPHPAHDSSQAGFTLIEALIAIVILAFGLIAITNLFLVAASSNTIGNATTAAAAQASERLETLKAIPFNQLGADGTDTRDIQGVGQIVTQWDVTGTGPNGFFIRVRSEAQGGLTGARSRAEFTTFRTCGVGAIGAVCGVPADCCSGNCNAVPPATGVCF